VSAEYLRRFRSLHGHFFTVIPKFSQPMGCVDDHSRPSAQSKNVYMFVRDVETNKDYGYPKSVRPKLGTRCRTLDGSDSRYERP
jgi:hypothetical protein